jgi:hypothetical protein
MGHTMEMFVGAGMVFGIPLGILLFMLWAARRFGPGIAYKQRRRQVEAAMHRDEYDRRVIEDVAGEWGYDPRRHYRRR